MRCCFAAHQAGSSYAGALVWTDDGGLDMQRRANRQWRQMLADYEPPAIDDAIDRELRAFIDDRKNATPDAWY